MLHGGQDQEQSHPEVQEEVPGEELAGLRALLRKRGDITLWFDEAAIDAWNAPPSGRPGGQRKYSDVAIVTALTLRTVFRLPLRQTEGFLVSLIRLMGLALRTPDHATLSRRSCNVEVPRFAKAQDGPLHLVVDSTGLKVLGDGEWLAHKHKTSNKRRSWRKLHLALDGDRFIVAAELTESGVADASVAAQMILGLDTAIERFTADGAYDTRAMYESRRCCMVRPELGSPRGQLIFTHQPALIPACRVSSFG